jgi:hypothetical protein
MAIDPMGRAARHTCSSQRPRAGLMALWITPTAVAGVSLKWPKARSWLACPRCFRHSRRSGSSSGSAMRRASVKSRRRWRGWCVRRHLCGGIVVSPTMGLRVPSRCSSFMSHPPAAYAVGRSDYGGMDPSRSRTDCVRGPVAWARPLANGRTRSRVNALTRTSSVLISRDSIFRCLTNRCRRHPVSTARRTQ